MSTVFKKFSKSDISIVPFNAHKQSTFTSASLLDAGGNFYSSSFPTISYRNGTGFDWAGSGSLDDLNNHKKYFQLNHLFYKNSKSDYINKFSTIKYFDHYRVLYDKVNILSLPYKTIGYEVKKESFLLDQSSRNIKDDGKGNLYDISYGTISSTTNTTNFKSENFRIFYLGPQNGHKLYNLRLKNGEEIVNFESTYSNDGKLDDSFLFNKIIYKDLNFSSKTLDGGNYPVLDFNGVSSNIKSPHNSRYNFNKDNFAISFFVSNSVYNPNNNDKKYLISKSTTKTVIQSPNEITNTQITGSSQGIEVEAEPQFPFEIYYQSSSINFDRYDGNVTSTVSTISTTCSMSKNRI